MDRVRALAVLFGGVLGGLAGGTLVLAQAGTFAEGMSAGRGFIAIAIVALGRWTPIGVVGGALLFGAASALQFAFQAMGWNAPYQVFLAVPYLLTLAALAGAVGRARAPAALGQALGAASMIAHVERTAINRHTLPIRSSSARPTAEDLCARSAHRPARRRYLARRRATELRSRRVEQRRPTRWTRLFFLPERAFGVREPVPSAGDAAVSLGNDQRLLFLRISLPG